MIDRQIEHIKDRIAQVGTVVVFLIHGRMKVMRRDHEKLDIMLNDPSMRRNCLGTYNSKATAEMIADDLYAITRPFAVVG